MTERQDSFILDSIRKINDVGRILDAGFNQDQGLNKFSVTGSGFLMLMGIRFHDSQPTEVLVVETVLPALAIGLTLLGSYARGLELERQNENFSDQANTMESNE